MPLVSGSSAEVDEDYHKIVQSARSLRAQPQSQVKPAASAPAKPASFTVNECPLCNIAGGKIPARIVHQSGEFIAFLDIMPKAIGHVAVIPRRHSRDFASMSEAERATYADFVAEVSARVKAKLGATGYVVVSPVGQSAGHVTEHFVSHIIPTYGKGPDLPVMNILQPEKVPEFVMEDIRQKMASIDAIAEGNRLKKEALSR